MANLADGLKGLNKVREFADDSQPSVLLSMDKHFCNQNNASTNYISVADSASLDTIPTNAKFTMVTKLGCLIDTQALRATAAFHT
jgi:hypothetical protein